MKTKRGKRLNTAFEKALLDGLQAESFQFNKHIQSLWGGYGSIDRIQVANGNCESAVLKHIRPDGARGRGSSISHQRKLTSYQIEVEFYKRYSSRCDKSCRVPTFIASSSHKNEQMIVMEDLDAAGFPLRREGMTLKQEYACLHWLANFHATFMNVKPDGLWDIGTYWHLATRQEEYRKMPNDTLKKNAHSYDEALNNAKYQTFVHGDAKPANFCFSPDDKVAAVDFQYVGGGCGIKDVTYFFWGDSPAHEQRYLDTYFGFLEDALERRSVNINFDELKEEWTRLYPIAKADFQRFLEGWML